MSPTRKDICNFTAFSSAWLRTGFPPFDMLPLSHAFFSFSSFLSPLLPIFHTLTGRSVDVYVRVTNRMWWYRLHHQSPAAINFNTGLTLQSNQLAIPPGILLGFLTAVVMITMLMVALLRAVELLVSRKTWVLNVTTDIMLLHVYSIHEDAAHSPVFVLPCDAIAFSYCPTCCLCIKMAHKETCYAFSIFLSCLSVSYNTWVVVHTEGFESYNAQSKHQ